MNIQFKKGALELLVLLIVKQEDQYGYSLSQIITNRIAISEGTIYPLLRKLVREEYLESYYTPSKEGPSRKYYSITSKGNVRLNLLLREWKNFTEAINMFVKESGLHE